MSNNQPNNHQRIEKQPQQQKPETQQQEQNEKILRRIGERTQMPTDKAQLIQYLSTRIKQAEEALIDTQQLLQSESGQSNRISNSINQRNKQLQKLYEIDQRALPEKIKEKLTSVLTETINQKLQAQQSLLKQKNKNYEFKSIYNELKWVGNNLNEKLQQQTKKQSVLNDDIQSLTTQNQTHQEQIVQLTKQFQQIKGQKQQIQDKFLQMKVALQRMTDIKSVLNRFFGNEDLFDQKMELKEQKILKPPPIIPQQQRLKSGISKQAKSNVQKLKPITNTNNDDDFWKGDFTRSNRPNFG